MLVKMNAERHYSCALRLGVDLTRLSKGLLSQLVAVQEFKLSCHNPQTMLFTIYPYYDNLLEVP